MESKKTLFVRNLPYSVTDKELENVFSRYGEVKTCFIVRNGEGCSKGYGFVYYRSSEDALKAKSTVKVFKGRPVQILFAEKKQQGETGFKKEEEEDYEEQTSHKETETESGKKKRNTKHSYDIGRILVLEALKASVTMKQIRVRCRKVGEVESINYPVPERQINTAFVTYVKHKDARVAVKKFDGKLFAGERIRAVLLSREGKVPSSASLKKSRLIVRNLDFKCTEEELEEVFSPYGTIRETHIPQRNGRSLGYGFVQYICYFDALKAMNTINGTSIKERKVAVDFATSKQKKEAKEKPHEEDEERDEMSDEESIEQISEETIEEVEDERNNGERNLGEEDSDKRKHSDVKEGRTLFIRNIPHDSDEDELRQVMEQFGRVRYCRLVLGDITGLCRGSAFVQYRDDLSVKNCLEVCNSSEGVLFNGIKLDVTVALSKEELAKLKKQKQNSFTVQKDKRNLYLLKEGVITKDSEAAKELSKAELIKRIRSFDGRKKKLKNPYYYISKTRLSVRNLPVTINEKKLKVLFKSHGGEEAVIKQVKLMRSKDKFTDEGLGRPLGYGFVEFTQHEAALRVLRSINNNPSVFGPHRRPIVEFALEDTRAIKLMKQRQKLQQKSTKTGNGDRGETHSNRRVKWKIKCKEKRLRRKSEGKTISVENKKKLPKTNSSAKNETMAKKRQVINSKPQQQQKRREVIKRRERQPKTKTNRTTKAFNDLVDKYRHKLSSQESRWFE